MAAPGGQRGRHRGSPRFSRGAHRPAGAFERLDARLARAPFLAGDALTEADIRLWVTLVRYDVGPNADRALNPGLHIYPHLWAYARRLYRTPAFQGTTDFASFTRPGARRPDWDAPSSD